MIFSEQKVLLRLIYKLVPSGLRKIETINKVKILVKGLLLKMESIGFFQIKNDSINKLIIIKVLFINQEFDNTSNNISYTSFDN